MMRQHEVPEGMDTPESDVEDLKYLRIGYVNQERKSDKLLTSFLALVPGDGKLPMRWHYRSHSRFLEKHGHLGKMVWAAASNSHLLLINGFHVLRIWTDASSTCWVDVADNVAGALDPQWISDIPANNARKSKPFTKRVKVWQHFQMQRLADAVNRTYGLHIPRF